MSFKDNLIRCRELAGYSNAADFARKLGISYTTYMGYENKGAWPPEKNLLKIAELLNVSVDLLIGFTTKEKDLPDEITLNRENKKMCRYVLYRKGIQNQILKLMEEMAELNQALIKNILYPEENAYEEKDKEETVDVIVTLTQLLMIKGYDKELINELAKGKLQRTIDKIKKGEE